MPSGDERQDLYFRGLHGGPYLPSSTLPGTSHAGTYVLLALPVSCIIVLDQPTNRIIGTAISSDNNLCWVCFVLSMLGLQKSVNGVRRIVVVINATTIFFLELIRWRRLAWKKKSLEL